VFWTKTGHTIFAHSRDRQSTAPPGRILSSKVFKTAQMSCPVFSCRAHNQQGIALVVTLLALVLITAMVVEFSYGVYTGTNSLYNWRDSQRLSVMAASGVNVIARFMKETANREDYKTQSEIEMPVANPFEDFNGTITVRIEDENSKFNMNALVFSNGYQNTAVYHSFQGLLETLSLDKKIADRVVDWIDQNNEAMLADSEAGAKNAALNSTDELLLINGISRKDYDTLLPYVTVDKEREHLMININSAKKPIIMCLADGIDERLAQQIIDHRKITPFESSGELDNIIGTGKISPQILIKFNGTLFSVKSIASSDGVKRIIETVIDTDRNTISYWKEY
jgi:general secretion pathway protein K